MSRLRGLTPAVITVIGLYTAAVFAGIEALMTQDGYYALVAGREVVEWGLPVTDRLGVMTLGRPWIDQPWLGQVVLYGVEQLGGEHGLRLVHAMLTSATFALAVALGAAERRDLIAAGELTVAGLVLLTSATALRTQALAFPLMVAVLALLARDRANNDRRIWLVPVLVALWANIHGSVLVGVGLVWLFALTAESADRWRLGALAIASTACAGASPYFADLPQYYASTAFNPAFGELIEEWKPPGLEARNVPLFVLVALAAGRILHMRSRIARFDAAVMTALAVAALLSARHMTWFALAYVVLVMPLGPSHSPAPRRWRWIPSAVASVAAAAAVAAAVARDDLPARGFPPAAAQVVQRLTAADRSLQVFADERFADWLLWRDPSLAGRIAYDIRFELLTSEELRRIARFKRQSGNDWRSVLEGYDLAVLRTDRAAGPDPGALGDVLYSDGHAAVVDLRGP